MSFTKKMLRATLSLANGNFDGGGNTLTIDKLRMDALIDVTAGVSSGKMGLDIYGLSLDVMNQMSTVGTQIDQQNKNSVQLYAGDADDDLNLISPTLVFSGSIATAMADIQNEPQACFRIEAMPGGGYDAVKPAPPTSLPGSQDVGDMLKSLAGLMGLSFENNGVSTKLFNPYYWGSAWTQAKEIAKHANIDMIVEKGVMAITPAGQPRGGDVPLISKETGMVGYPAFREAAVIVKCAFNPVYKGQGQVQIQSDITPACGTWTVFHMTHALSCRSPHGNWFSILECTQAKGAQDPS